MNTAGKLVTVSKALRLRASWKKAGKRVVFANGVFDVLHAGHVDLLEKARALGDLLIVAVNSDKSARTLEKGPGRPFNRLQDRMRLLAALQCVDAVVPFNESTPERLLSKFKPDVLVKGADYRPEQVAGRRHARELALIRLKKGYSTTRLAERIARALRP